MSLHTIDTEASRIDEPQQLGAFADVLSRVAADRHPVVIRRDGADLAAVVPIEHLELLQDLVARQEAEALASSLDWDGIVKANHPPQDWFDGEEPKPFARQASSR